MDPSEQGEGATAAEMLAPFAGYLHSNVEVSVVIPPPAAPLQREAARATKHICSWL